MTTTRPVYQATAQLLLEHGAREIFGLMGDANMLYVADYRDRGGRFVAAVHEAGAVAMADAYSRMTGKVGVATVTHGPGLTNAMTALTEATRSGSAILLLTGDTPEEPTHFQRIDIAAVASAAGAGYHRVNCAQSLCADLTAAFHVAETMSHPIVLDLPAALLQAQTSQRPDPRAPVTPAIPELDPDDLDGPLGLLLSANRPLILAGRGAVTSGARDNLIELAELLGAPLATTVLAKELFAGHPANLGICGNLAHSVAADAIATADTVIAFGASLNRFTTYNRELISTKRLIHVDLDPDRYGSYVAADEVVTGDARQVAQAMLDALRGAGDDLGAAAPSEWLEGIKKNLFKYRPGDDFVDHSGQDSVDPRTAAIKLNSALPARRNLVSDVGRFVNAAWPYLQVLEARHFAAMVGFGAIGLGLAGAIGAAVACPDTPTVAVLGDGGFIMNPAELTTAVREGLDLIVLVFNDGAYGAEYHKLKLLGVDPAHSLTSWPPVDTVAESFGAQAHTVRTLSELDQLTEALAERTGPVVIDLRLDPTLDIIMW
jgi:acetolactate synthase I/II/III large subunit